MSVNEVVKSAVKGLHGVAVVQVREMSSDQLALHTDVLRGLLGVAECEANRRVLVPDVVRSADAEPDGARGDH